MRDVPRPVVEYPARLLAAHRRRIGTRQGTPRAGAVSPGGAGAELIPCSAVRAPPDPGGGHRAGHRPPLPARGQRRLSMAMLMSPLVAIECLHRWPCQVMVDLLVVRVRACRMRKDSPSVTTTVAWRRSRSSKLVAVTCSGRKRPH